MLESEKERIAALNNKNVENLIEFLRILADDEDAIEAFEMNQNKAYLRAKSDRESKQIQRAKAEKAALETYKHGMKWFAPSLDQALTHFEYSNGDLAVTDDLIEANAIVKHDLVHLKALAETVNAAVEAAEAYLKTMDKIK